MSYPNQVDPRILQAAKHITAKRPSIVIKHIIENGYVTTEQLKNLYGYNHAPRAARDVREAGIPLETFKVKSSDGRAIAAYRFGDLDKIEAFKLEGRQTFSKTFKNTLVDIYKSKCCITGEVYAPIYLQIDHRVPYEIAGDNAASENDPNSFMLLTGTSQRQKSWCCEHCENFLEFRQEKICRECYWAYPENYLHIAMTPIRMITIEFKDNGDALDNEIAIYNKVKKLSAENNLTIQDFIKIVLNGL